MWLLKKTRWWQRHRGLMGDINFQPITRANSERNEWKKLKRGELKKSVARGGCHILIYAPRNYCSQSFLAPDEYVRRRSKSKGGEPLKINFARESTSLIRFYSIDLTIAVVIFLPSTADSKFIYVKSSLERDLNNLKVLL